MPSASYSATRSSSLVSMPGLIAAIPIICPVGSWIEDSIKGVLSGGSVAPTPFDLPVALWSLISALSVAATTPFGLPVVFWFLIIALFMVATAAYVFALIIVCRSTR